MPRVPFCKTQRGPILKSHNHAVILIKSPGVRSGVWQLVPVNLVLRRLSRRSTDSGLAWATHKQNTNGGQGDHSVGKALA